MGNKGNAPNAAAPMVNASRIGAKGFALNEVVVGPFRMAARADRPPAMPQVIRLTRDTEIPRAERHRDCPLRHGSASRWR